MEELSLWMAHTVGINMNLTYGYNWWNNLDGIARLESKAREGRLKGWTMEMAHVDGDVMVRWWPPARVMFPENPEWFATVTELESRLRALALALVAAGGDK